MIKIWLLIAIFALLIILGIIGFFVLKIKKKKFQPDYYTLFILGLLFFVIGIASGSPVIWILGIVFFIIGITHKNKWKKRKAWKTMNKKQKKLSIILMIVLGILLITGLLVLVLTDNWDKIIGGENVSNETLVENNDSITGSTVDEEQIKGPYAIIRIIDDNETG